VISQENVYSVIAIITPGIISLLMENRKVDWRIASEMLYNSTLYNALEVEETKLWHLSAASLYDILEEELTTGKITNIPEEQS
jgi:hypothetical protein